MVLERGFSPQEKDEIVISLAHMKGMNSVVRNLLKYYKNFRPGSIVDIIVKRLK